MTCIKTGARVHVLSYDLVFAADLYEIAGAIVVRANGPIVRGKNAEVKETWEAKGYGRPTHVLHADPEPAFWRMDVGVFVVPKAQCVAGVA